MYNVERAFPTTGQRATIDIYDRDGHRIHRLSDNRICGTDERFRWDGVTDDGRTVSNGLYVVFVRVWNLEGRTKNFHQNEMHVTLAYVCKKEGVVIERTYTLLKVNDTWKIATDKL